MLLDVSQALNSSGVSFGFALSEAFEPMCNAGEEIRFLKPVEISGSYVFTGEIFFLLGTIKAVYAALCCRCLKEVRTEMSIGFSEEFGREPDEDHPDRYLFQGERIELGQMAGDLISLNTPMRHLCGEGCRGLCPVCGADRNISDCRCALNAEEEAPATVQ
jgi:uncharacterized protein